MFKRLVKHIDKWAVDRVRHKNLNKIEPVRVTTFDKRVESVVVYAIAPEHMLHTVSKEVLDSYFEEQLVHSLAKKLIQQGYIEFQDNTILETGNIKKYGVLYVAR